MPKISLLFLLLLIGSMARAETPATRVALVIGNEKYESSIALACPVNDAKTVAKVLKTSGFVVTELHDLTKKQMLAAVQQFGDSLQEGGVAFFYYSGHGVQSGGRNYLVPVDANLQTKLTERNIDLESLFGTLKSAHTAANIVVLDCCRSKVAPQNGARGFANVEAPANTVLAFATAPGSTALDGAPPGPGPYSSALSRYLAEPGVEILDALRRAATDVKKETSGVQQPWFHTDMNERFYMKPDAGKTGPNRKFQDGEMSASILTFARRFLAADESNDPGVVLQFYAGTVENYFGTEDVTGADIVEDRRKGIATSPVRHYTLDRPPVISRSDSAGFYTIICERQCEFSATQGGPTKKRPSHVAFKVRPHGESWEIFYITAHQPKKDDVARKSTEGTFDRAALEQFIISFDSADEEDDPAVGMKFFAAKVDKYFETPNADAAMILADRKDHRARWPIRRYRPQTYRVVNLIPGGLRVEYVTKYEHTRGKTTKTGDIKNLLTLRLINERTFEVTSIEAAK